ncbi:MAG: hypothetical protein ACREIF_15350 [Chthoniobacterales bacterium]
METTSSQPTATPTPAKKSSKKPAASTSSTTETITQSSLVIRGAEVPSAYGAPPSFSQSRFGPLTNAYVLPSGSIYTSMIYEGDAVHFRKPDHNFTQEVEIGLPYRFNAALETSVEAFSGTAQVSSFSLEARYAFADWDKIPLNPTLFSEFKFGIGDILHDEGAPTPPRRFGPGGFDMSQSLPDSSEVRLLLSEEFFGRIEWALNTFFEQELGGDRGREWGLAQTVVTPVLLPNEELKVGIETLFRSFSDKTSRGTPYNSVVIGPTIGWKPTRSTRFDLSPLIGVNEKSPQLEMFAVFSVLFGGGGGHESEAPASTRNR